MEHINRVPVREACGLLVNINAQEKYWPCRNVAEENSDFRIHREDWTAAERAGKILAVVHSHPYRPSLPSEADKVACERTKLPWHIVSVPDEHWTTITPSGYKAPLIGREFMHGILDCYTLVQDFFMEEYNIELPYFDREFEWWHKGQNLYLDNFKNAGFFEIDFTEMRRGDCILMQLRSPVPNHAGVYMGDGLILHHAFGRLSGRDVYGEYYQKNTYCYLRHEKVQA